MSVAEQWTGEVRMNDVVEYLVANPILLIPILLIVAMVVYAIIKRLLKVAAIVVIAGALYVLLVEYLRNGM
jgi:hypothetical protein